MARGGTDLNDVDFPAVGQAIRPLAPVHGQISVDGGGDVTIGWTRRSRVDAGWRDHVDQPTGESREAWHVELSPPVPGIGPWERASPSLVIGASERSALPSGCLIEIRQVGDLALSPPLSLPLT